MLNINIIMIKKISTSIKNIGTKTLILIIALSFAVWGIGDIFTGDSNPTIATVGDSKIKLKRFNLEYQAVLQNLRQSSDQPLTEEFLKSMGLQNSVLNNMINKEYINILSKELGINITPKYIKKSLIQNRIFHDQLGVFNQDYFNYFLNRNNISESELLSISKNELINDIFIKSLEFSSFTPKIVANNLINKRDLVRKAEVYEIDTSAMLINKKLSQNEIKEKYEKVKSNILNPERRSINLIFINKDNIDTNILLKEKELLDIYNANKKSYSKSEKRKLMQFIFEEKEEAVIFAENIKNMTDIDEYLSKEGIKKESVTLEVEEGELEEKINLEAFKLKEKQFSKPLNSSFGWKVLYIENIIAENITTFKDVKDEIKKDLTTDLLNERIYEKANLFYESFIENNNLEDSLKKTSLKKIKLENIDLNNIAPLLKQYDLDTKEDTFIKIVFNLNENSISDPIEDEALSLVFVHLEKVTPASPKNFSDAKNDVIAILNREIKQNIALKNSTELLTNLLEKKKIDINKYKYTKTDWLTNDSRVKPEFDIKIKNIIFKTPMNNYSQNKQIDEFKYVIVKPIEQSNKLLDTKKTTSTEEIKLEVSKQIDNDLLGAMLDDLKTEKKSSVNQTFLDSF